MIDVPSVQLPPNSALTITPWSVLPEVKRPNEEQKSSPATQMVTSPVQGQRTMPVQTRAEGILIP